MWACFWIHFRTPSKMVLVTFFMISRVPKWVQKGDFISGLGVHGAPWAPKSAFGPESCISRPPKVIQGLKNGAKVVETMIPNLARRTARSELNPPPPVRENGRVF